MKRFAAIALLLAACSQESTPPAAQSELWMAGARDRLCLKANRAGFIVYGADNANCSVRGTFERDGDVIIITPTGDGGCKFSGNQWFGPDGKPMMALGPFNDAKGACDYYCGPGATLDDVQLEKSAAAGQATDFAGDPLC